MNRLPSARGAAPRLTLWRSLCVVTWLAALLTVAGCGDESSCGPGTVQVAGKCVVLVDALSCGPGTSAVQGVCVADVVGADVAAGTDAAAETDAATQSDAIAQTDIAETDAAVGSDTATQTDAAVETDAAADTDVASATDATADTDATGETDAVDPPDVCKPNCIGRVCGPDGCGGTCGSCNGTAKPTCNELTGQCEASCVPQCDGKNCGDNGCGGDCGTCGSGSTCADFGVCVPDAWTCDKTWYAAADACDCDCGTVDPDCGLPFMGLAGCEEGETCSPAGVCEAKAPAGWTCDKLAYDAKDYCDCGCGALDPDCGYGLPVKGCTSQGATCSAAGSCVECVANCSGKTCGPDGCGGICGTCDDPDKPTCNDTGACIDPCVGAVKFACEKAECGDDFCGGSCGTCGSGKVCKVGKCVDEQIVTGDSCVGYCGSKAPFGCSCVPGCDALGTCCGDFTTACACKPACDGKLCGPDGCGGTCGSCGGGTPYCESDSGQCLAACVPKCDGKQCGDDGCGGSCGACGSGEVCGFTSQCVPATWKCDQSYYADGYACDCGCGAGDPDCTDSELSVFGCPNKVACTAQGTCSGSFCTANSDCGSQWCMGVWAKSASSYAGMCGVPLQSSSSPGTPCEFNEQCASNVCLGELCRLHCGADADCTGNQRCLGLAVVDAITASTIGYTAACAGVTGTGQPCTKQADCASTSETCIGRVDPLTLGARYLCELTPALPAPGASCLLLDCPDWQVCVADKNGSPVCASHCPGGASDCPSGFGCVQRPLHNNGTPLSTDDPQVPLCLPN